LATVMSKLEWTVRRMPSTDGNGGVGVGEGAS
jgi:hypothetical protein